MFDMTELYCSACTGNKYTEWVDKAEETLLFWMY
jgi:hypothetical protein